MKIKTRSRKQPVVCFSKNRYQIFEELDNSSTTCCVLTKFNENGDAILRSGKSKRAKLEFDFEGNEMVEIADIKTIVSQCNLYSRVSSNALITNSSIISQVNIKFIHATI